MRYFYPHIDKKINWNKVDQVALDMLNDARGIAGVPFRITSHYRSPEKNDAVGGKSQGAHTEIPCSAFDIEVKDSRQRYKVIAALILAGFKRIGIYQNHVHADTSNRLPDEVIWIEIEEAKEKKRT